MTPEITTTIDLTGIKGHKKEWLWKWRAKHYIGELSHIATAMIEGRFIEFERDMKDSNGVKLPEIEGM